MREDRFQQGLEIANVQIRAPRMIWADRLAIAGFIGIVGFSGLLSSGAALSYPLPLAEVAGLGALAIWVVGRLLDFVITGRLR